MVANCVNDVTTTPINPPIFGPDCPPYDAKAAAAQARRHPDLGPLTLKIPRKAVFGRVLETAQKMHGWKLEQVDEAACRITLVATTPLLRFRDDVVIEIRPGADVMQAAVHMRSRSRVGRHDFGANYKRIKKFFGQIEKTI